MAAFNRPGVAVGLLICMFGIENFLATQSVYFCRHGNHVNFAVAVVVMVAAACVYLRAPKTPLAFGRIQQLALALYAFGFLSYFWTLEPDIFLARWGKSVPYLVIYLVAAPILCRDKHTLRDGLRWALYIGTPILFLAAFYCEWGTRGMVLAAPMKIGNVVWREAFPLAVASTASTIGIIALVIQLRFPFAFMFRLLVLSVAFYVGFLTHSRGQVVALLVVAIFVYPLANKNQNSRMLLVSLLSFLVISVIVYFVAQNVDLWRWQRATVEYAIRGRQLMVMKLLREWWNASGLTIVVGLGANSSFKIVGGHPHNLPVEILAELGLVGASLFTWILGTSMANIRDLLRYHSRHGRFHTDALAVIGVLGVNAALSMKEGSLDGWHALFFYAICLNQLTAAYARERPPQRAIHLAAQT